MVRDPHQRPEPPDPETVLDILADEDARMILHTLNDPMTAQELHERCAIPESTLYRKLDRMTDAGLLEERTRIRPDGRHASEYRVGFESVTITHRDDTDGLVVAVTPAPKAPDERLAELWSEVSREV